MQQIYRRTPMSKCDFNKVASNFIKIALWHGCSPINLLHILRPPFPKNTSGRLLLCGVPLLRQVIYEDHIQQTKHYSAIVTLGKGVTYMFKVNSKDNRTTSLTSSEQISQLFLVLFLLALNNQMFCG